MSIQNEVTEVSNDDIIEHTRAWIETVVVECNFCPFAKQELQQDSISYVVSHTADMSENLQTLIAECVDLDEHEEVATSLIIFPEAYRKFEDYLQLLEMADALMIEQGYEGVYQLASFHPHYCFEDVSPDDASNYTNRSPYPMLHLLREASIEQALANFSEPEQIPQRNIDFAREIGGENLATLRDACFHVTAEQE